MKEELKLLIEKAIKKLGLENVHFSIDRPEKPEFGDYSTNIALVLGKKNNRSPKELAEDLIKNFELNKNVARIEVAGPGFINFFLSKDFYIKEIEKILKEKDKYGKNKNLKKEKTIIEYTDPNPFKEFHIGHLMSNTIGEAISRIVEWNGAEVKRANYQGDVGLHVAKAIWGKIKKPNLSWGESYAYGSVQSEQDKDILNEIKILNKKIYEMSDKEINKLYKQGRKESLDRFEEIYKLLGTKFDFYFFESETGEFGKKIVLENKNIFEESEGAIVYRGENRDKNLHTRVFISKEGLPTYEAKELGLAKIKHSKYKYGKSIVITGNEVDNYFRVVLSAMKEIFPELREKTTHISHGMLKLPEGKMSSRTGSVVKAEDLIEEITKKIIEKIADREIADTEKNEIAEIVAIGALKYSILKQSTGKDIIFDFDKSISFEGDSGPYLQYTYVRTNSILDKAKKEGIKTKITDNLDPSVLEAKLIRFSELVERAGNELAPQIISNYLVDLAGEFNAFYAKEKIVDKNDPSSQTRVAISQAVGQVIKNGLEILGIKVPKRM